MKMKMCLIPTFLTPASRDHLHMCLSKIAQAGQVSPVCEIKLAAVFIDLNVQKAKGKKKPQIKHTWRFFFFFPQWNIRWAWLASRSFCHSSHVRMTGRSHSGPMYSWPPGCDAHKCEVFEDKTDSSGNSPRVCTPEHRLPDRLSR